MNPADLEAIQKLKAEWDSLQPLSKENEDRLWRKLRLEWDYHSNHIEGNTLTYGETELLIIFGETRGSHTLREYEEMKAHDVAIQHVREIAKEARPLSEADIRGLNQRLLKEPFWKPAITADGSPTQKQIIPGQYKVQPNNVRTATGEPFNFVDPLDVPKRMHEYLKFLNGECPSGAGFLPHLARIHHEFLLIHPFDDGNGRVGRLLLNYLLLKNGYPPIVIRTEQKNAYRSALHRADTAERDYSELTEFIGSTLRASLQLGCKAAMGESIEEPSDIEKEIALFANQAPPGTSAEPKTRERILELWKECLGPFFRKFVPKMDALKPLFEEITVLPGTGNGTNWEVSLSQAISDGKDSYFALVVKCEHYKLKTNHPFSYSIHTGVHFNRFDYQIFADLIFYPPPRFYSQPLNTLEIDDLISSILKGAFEKIKESAERI